MLEKILVELQESKELCSIEYEHAAKTIYGYVEYYHEKYTVVKEYDTEGLFTGYTIIRTWDIEEITWANSEHKTISKLIEHEESFIQERINPEIFKEDFYEVVVAASGFYGFIELYDSESEENSLIIGKVLEHDENWFLLECIGNRYNPIRFKRLFSNVNVGRIVIKSSYTNKYNKISER